MDVKSTKGLSPYHAANLRVKTHIGKHSQGVIQRIQGKKVYGESTKKTSCRVTVSVSNTMWMSYLVTVSPHNRRENVPWRLA